MSSAARIDVVTGAFSYSGAAISRDLQAAGHAVTTLTAHPERAPAGSRVTARPLDFTEPDRLAESLRGAHTLYNTYWVRFARGAVDHEAAVTNSQILFSAAAQAGVQRIVHVSITNPSMDSPYPYFRGKAQVEQILANSGVPYAIARPAILFGGDGVLVNNIAWLLRRLPVFALGGDGSYRIRGIHVDDLAALLVRLGTGSGRGNGSGSSTGGSGSGGSGGSEPEIVDAVGPQSLTFREMVTAIRAAVGSRAALVPVPGRLIPALSGALGTVLRDTLLTADEYRAMADGLADSAGPATGPTVSTDWVRRHGSGLGRDYANEIHRHFRGQHPASSSRRSLPGPG
ncbi:MAG: SDR family oxidoreductase [Streptosporangiaceae bacterium]